ncbi:MAG: SAM-dependent methyltransferase [Clostridia bacterium]|nr:SAM-dependent methyltransferase [Clostridia bacterium]
MRAKLDNRLTAAAALIIPGKPVADIGTDHLLLPLYLVQNGIVPRVIASDKARQPYENALALAQEQGLDQWIELRLGEGLEVLNPGEAATIVIAGLGGRLIRDILAAGKAVLVGKPRLVLQPQKDAALLRRWLAQQGWRIMAETIAYEGGHYYQLLAAEPGRQRLTRAEAEFGPCLLRQAPPLLRGYLGEEKSRISALIVGLNAHAGPAAQRRLRQLHAQLRKIKEVLAGLPCRESDRD